MKSTGDFLLGALALLLLTTGCQTKRGLGVTESGGSIQVVAERNTTDSAGPEFKFKTIPAPARNDAASIAQFSLVAGRQDRNGGSLDKLHDGKAPTEEDAPTENFFFSPGTEGGRILVDLGRSIAVKQVNSYSWHPGMRGPQVYTLYGREAKGDEDAAPLKNGADPEPLGWKRVAQVDTRPPAGESGGQYGVSIFRTSGLLGQYRYLLLAVSRTAQADSFGNTFYSEIDVVDQNGPALEAIAPPAAQAGLETVEVDNYKISFDTSETPDLTEWARKEVAPMVQAWYPKLIKMLPSEGFEAPKKFSIAFSQGMQGVAATSGTRIKCAAKWFRANLKGEAKGAIFHEMVHVVQQYGRVRPATTNTTRAPGWLTEGLTDYIRWYHYEPQSRGAEIRNLARARYDGSYRVTANFLNWVSEKYDRELAVKLNAAIREGRYNEAIWEQFTGEKLQPLGEKWKANLEQTLGAATAPPSNPPPAKP